MELALLGFLFVGWPRGWTSLGSASACGPWRASGSICLMSAEPKVKTQSATFWSVTCTVRVCVGRWVRTVRQKSGSP